jgi:hypothetical protein
MGVKIHTASKRSLDTLIVLYDLHTRLFQNVIDGISDVDAQNRLNTKANHIAWLTGSLVHERFELANAAGVDAQQSGDEFFMDQIGIQDDLIYPSMTVYKKDWNYITPVLKKALLYLSEEELAGPGPYGVPGDGLSFFDAITFIIDRESYCIGQIGLYRRLLGYEAMKYE